MLGSEFTEEEPEADRSTPQLYFSLCSIWCQNKSSWSTVLEIRIVIILGLRMKETLPGGRQASVRLVRFYFWDLFNFEVSSNYTIIIWAFIYKYVTLWLKVKINICIKVKMYKYIKIWTLSRYYASIKYSPKNFDFKIYEWGNQFFQIK